MTILHLYNTQSRKKEIFQPIDSNNVRLYVCGPTVYDFAHIGNARPVVVFDILYRLLNHIYGEKHVTYVRNITDVDDKIMLRAKEQNIDIRQLTTQTTDYFHQDMDALGALRPKYEPRATDHIQEMIELIQILIEKNYAYEAENHVLFHVLADKNYGKLSNRSTDDMIAGARVEVAPYKKSPMDFVLWKPSIADQEGWESPWGYGRPGWHIECSAMSKKWLGNHFDIHGGGIDLVFPHHENEIAQSCCANDTPYVNIWMHNGFLQVEGEKMSKSLGNFITVHQLLNEQKIAGEVIRMVLLRTHYRQPLDWTQAAVEECKTILDKWYRLTENIDINISVSPDEKVMEALYDDLNTPKAFSLMHQLEPNILKATAQFLGFLKQESQTWFHGSNNLDINHIEKMIEQRIIAKKNKDFAQADSIRNTLKEKGILLEDTAQGTIWRKE